jgi:hypothetical protein
MPLQAEIPPNAARQILSGKDVIVNLSRISAGRRSGRPRPGDLPL